jgi:hypothetical protein
MARKKAKKRLYLVQRLGWNVWEYHGRGQCTRDEEDHGVPVRAFTDKKSADALCDQLELECRRDLNPFQFEGGEMELLTSLDEEGFAAGLQALGLTPPTPKTFPYLNSDTLVDQARWWDATCESMTDVQRAGVWALLDKLKLYRVVQTELED